MTAPRCHLMILLAMLVLTTVTTPYYLTDADKPPSMSITEFEEITCETIYFLNAIYVRNSTLNTTLYLETPQNLSLGPTLNQTSITLYVKNLNFSKEHRYYAFNITPGRKFYGFFLSKVVVCGPDRVKLRQIIDAVIRNLRYKHYYKARNETIPPDIASKYLLAPHDIVVKVLRPEFEAWLKTMFNVSAKNLSKLAITIAAAYYIYGQFYITYSPSPYPRPLAEVVKEKKGDCDDMSRVLTDLLRSYGIPALIAYGYVVIEAKWLKHYVIPVENTTYIFHYAGPHAFTIAYVPGLGWMPIDLLAGSMIVYPFIFENFSVTTDVNKTAVEEFKNMSRKLIAIQLVAALSENEYKKILNYSSNPIEAISFYINKTMGLINATIPTTTITTVTPSTTRTTSHTVSTSSSSTSTSIVHPSSKTVTTTTPQRSTITVHTQITSTSAATSVSGTEFSTAPTHVYTTLSLTPTHANNASTLSYIEVERTTSIVITSSPASISRPPGTTCSTPSATYVHTYPSSRPTGSESQSISTQPRTSITILIPAIAIMAAIVLAATILRKAL